MASDASRIGTYFFGAPILSRAPSADGARRVFVLGAYPSALHVRWRLPDGIRRPSGSTYVSAVAVGDEPTPFWDGHDAAQRVAAWKASLPPEWGVFENESAMNGPSGQKLTSDYLDALGVDRSECWITDCVDHYFGSESQHRNIAFYESLSAQLGLPGVELPPHPSERDIVSRAKHHLSRLGRELDACRPEEVVTLGNAALSTLRELVTTTADAPRQIKVAADGSGAYGDSVVVRRGDWTSRWWPLAHVAARDRYRTAHQSWIERQPAALP